MNGDDDLKKLWQQQPLRDTPSAGELMAAMQQQTAQLRRTLNGRDLRELVACAFIAIVFGYFAIFSHADEPISRFGDCIIIGSTIFIAWKMIHARRKNRPAPPGATTAESLRAELNSVRAQSKLLGSILWWYLLPLAIGLFVITWGSTGGGLGGKIGYSIFVIALYTFIYWLNQRARAQQFLPLEAQLASLLHSAETGEPLDETHAAAARPIALSMAAADRVKPAEFKVAFWQIALWGEVGFIGIWFFLMIGLRVDPQRWSSTNHPSQPLVQLDRAEQTNRYSIVALKVARLLNAGEHAAVHSLYNSEMIEAFPPQETTDFYTRLATRHGDIERIEVPASDPDPNGWMTFRLHCRYSELTMRLALDADDKISGIHFRPSGGVSATIKSLGPRVLSWHRLVWIVPFFLAGLLYSWLIQKTTERAVGISNLGIHLQKGQSLLLWDEIKEVRPLKVLNIRSLWLISESGEKTIMPWTSLEGHRDLKAAVESFAPATHPIRNFLPLLNRS